MSFLFPFLPFFFPPLFSLEHGRITTVRQLLKETQQSVTLCTHLVVNHIPLVSWSHFRA